jgi:outer membrane protein assembly factor BamB
LNGKTFESAFSTKHEAKVFSAALIAVLAISVILAALPSVLAEYTKMPDRPTATEVAASPTLIGLGQEVLINIMTYPAPSGPTYEAQSLVPGLTGGFSNISLTITHPDGTKETFMPIDETLEQVGIRIPGQQQIVGHLQFHYKPKAVGNYTLSASFPGKTYTTDNQYMGLNLSVYYKPSSSTFRTQFTVQEELVLSGQLNGYPWSPLPEDYWENPVQTDNREWYAISGDWPQIGYNIEGSNYNPFSKAPNSPHIIWAQTVSQSGLGGGIWGSLPYAATGHGTFAGAPVILDGKFYQAGRAGYFNCYDLRTGELLWEAPGSITQAQRINPEFQTASQQNQGAIDKWLWGGTAPSLFAPGTGSWQRYDPYTGNLLQNITNVPMDLTGLKFEDGSPIVWAVQADMSTFNTTLPMKLTSVNLIKWNYSRMVTTIGFFNIPSNNWQDGVEWNVSAVQPDQVSIGDNNFRGPNIYPYREANIVVVKTPNAMQIAAGYDYTTGKFVWKNNATVLDIDVLLAGIATSPAGPLIKFDGASPNLVAYDVKTGQEIWRASTGNLPWGMVPGYTYVYNNNTLFMGSYDGHVYAYDIKTGKRVWQSDFLGEEAETIYNNQPFNGMAAGADGKVYFSTATTYNTMPRNRFTLLACFNEADGKMVWKLPIGVSPTVIADGYLLGTDVDNGIQYAIGKGKTQTSITAITWGTGLLLQGSVLDMSPGKPNTPAVSEAVMSEWMDYLYGQNATLLNNPPKPDGVEVRLSAVDANGTVTDIGTATTDSIGQFSIKWTPPTEEIYKVTATFDGSESYWGSWAQTSLAFAEGEISTGGSTTPTVSSESSTDTLMIVLVAGVVAIIVAIAVVGLLIIRRK